VYVNTRFLNGIAKHPDLQTDPSFVDFLEVDSDLPRATSTSALSGAGVLRLFSRVGDSIGKIAYKMDEVDPVSFICLSYSLQSGYLLKILSLSFAFSIFCAAKRIFRL